MTRKNIILTLWLIAPLATFAGLYAMIFVTLDKDKPMSDAAPIGAGAGDTGNANALGQWRAGRDPDAVSLATKAKRERLMISPMDWPGGVELRIPARAIDAGDQPLMLTQVYNEQGRFSTTKPRSSEPFLSSETTTVRISASSASAGAPAGRVSSRVKPPSSPHASCRRCNR